MKIIESKIVGQSVTRWQVYSQHHNEELLGHVGTILKTPRLWFKVESVDHEEIGCFDTLEGALNAIGERFRWPTNRGERTAADIRRDIEDIEKRIEALEDKRQDLWCELDDIEMSYFQRFVKKHWDAIVSGEFYQSVGLHGPTREA